MRLEERISRLMTAAPISTSSPMSGTYTIAINDLLILMFLMEQVIGRIKIIRQHGNRHDVRFRNIFFRLRREIDRSDPRPPLGGWLKFGWHKKRVVGAHDDGIATALAVKNVDMREGRPVSRD